MAMIDNPILDLEQLSGLLRYYRGDTTQQEVEERTKDNLDAKPKLLTKTISKLENDPGKSTVETLFEFLNALAVTMVVRTRTGGSSSKPVTDANDLADEFQRRLNALTKDGDALKAPPSNTALAPKTIAKLMTDPATSTIESLLLLLSAFDMEMAILPKGRAPALAARTEW